ncbi:MAG: HD domain-containing protein [Candidatus Thermoplasmatota archaeon]|nr:HD domain-containing protein [Candidatus Thermoplasmatota archaeon]
MFKAIQDPVWGYTEIPEKFLKIIDTPEFQRLHWIRQLGMCYLVYPGAVHTRFQHSLGTMALADQIARKLETKYPTEVTFAALLHDIGHFPLSHSFEDFFQDKFHVNHEENGREMILGKKGTGEIRECLESNDIDPEVVTRILSGGHREFKLESEIVSGPLDADEMDYLVRDSYFTGTGNIAFSIKRMVDILRTDGEKIFIEEKGITSVESILLSRNLMHKSVYFHKTVRIAQKMIERAMDSLDKVDSSMMDMHDDIFLNYLRNQASSSDMIRQIDRRNLYKVVYRDSAPDIRNPEIESKIHEKYPELIVDYVPPYAYQDRKKSKNEVLVKQGRKFMEISSLSPLINSLYDSFNRRYITIYGPQKLQIRQEEIRSLLD